MKIVMPMAGLGSRFKIEGYDIPKPLIQVNGKTLVEHSVESLNIDGEYIFITRKFDDKKHNEELSRILKKLKPNSTEITIDQPTRGSVETAMFARTLINNDEELIITNCDQILKWNSDAFLEQSRKSGIHGSLLLFFSSDPKNSFAEVDDHGIVTRVVEKQVISTDGLVGVHYWSKGSDFVQSGDKLLRSFEEDGRKECYISETYNYLIEDGKRIAGVRIPSNQFIPLGTPKDLSLYLGKIKEFYTEKPKTIFCDIDGTILKHIHRFSDLIDVEPTVLPGVIKKINEWDSQGHKIVLCTARKESARKMTEEHLTKLGLCWDILLMGMTSGCRVLINDKLNQQDMDRAKSVNVITDGGFETVDWSKYGL
jgi:NDP-sugar pyrophosphorylase family protein